MGGETNLEVGEVVQIKKRVAGLESALKMRRSGWI